MHAPPVWISFNEIILMLGCSEFSVDFNLFFQRSDMLVLAMYTNEFIIIAGGWMEIKSDRKYFDVY